MTTDTSRPLAVVTGASSGIGFELARVFAQHGFDLVVCAEDDGLAPAVNRLEGFGAAVTSIRADLGTFDGVERLYERIKAGGRPVDAIAINAGIGVGGDFMRETDLMAELQLVDLNCRSTVHLAKRVGVDMVARGQGRMLFTASIAADMPAPYEAVYGASKAFVLSFSEALRSELADTGVTVTALKPGPTETEFFDRAGMQNSKVGASDSKDDAGDVAEQGFEALMAGKDAVVAGSRLNRVQSAVAKVVPDRVAAAGHAQMSEPGSAKD